MKLVLVICKLANFILKKMGKGSTFPGSLAYKLNKKILNYFKIPELVIAVTGSAGKGSTTKIIAQILEKNNKKVVYNKSGGNLLPGILSVLIDNSDLNGNIKADALVMEVDERYTKAVFKVINPKYVVVTNISRDQPPRNIHVDVILDKIKEALDPSMKLILNGDDPILRNLDLEEAFEKIYFGIEKNELSYTENKFNSLNINYCPKCNSRLKYNFYHIEAVGDYYCTKCDFKRPNIDFKATKIDLDNNYMIINENKVAIAFNILYYAYNILAAYSVCSMIGIEEKDICKYISDMENNSKLNNSYKYKDKNVYVLSNKNENNMTFNQSVLFASNKKTEKTIVIGWKEISRRYKYNDMSWLYDIEFELLNDSLTKKIVCIGRDKFDIGLRMKYAGFENEKIKIYETLQDAEQEIKSSNGDIIAILNFDYVVPFNKMMMEEIV